MLFVVVVERGQLDVFVRSTFSLAQTRISQTEKQLLVFLSAGL
jgi:hypothetical protein